jgi:hypothetical protein
MATIVTRASKGSALTHNEVDANFENLNNSKEDLRVPATSAEMQSGAQTEIRSMSPLRVKQAIEALSSAVASQEVSDRDFGINLI